MLNPNAKEFRPSFATPKPQTVKPPTTLTGEIDWFNSAFVESLVSQPPEPQQAETEKTN